MAYCLQNKIRFTLYSGDANYGSDGWKTYFKSFCPEVQEPFHHHYNHRLPWLSIKNEILKMVQFFPALYYRKKFSFDYFTYQILRKMWAVKDFHATPLDVPELGLQGSVRDALPLLLKMVWRLNDEVRTTVDKLIAELKLPEEYTGMQLRFGDKVIEMELVDTADYLLLAEKVSDLKEVFILSDDYKLGIEKTKELKPEWRVYTFADEADQGFVLNALSARAEDAKRSKIIKLIASVECLLRAKHFVGIAGANPSYFVEMGRSYQECVFVDR
jgi:hypothetical protein